MFAARNLFMTRASAAAPVTYPSTLTAQILVGARPVGLAISADGTRVYTANQNGNNVSVINTATNAVTATVTGVGSGPLGAVAGKMDILSFFSDGTNWYGSIAGGYTP